MIKGKIGYYRYYSAFSSFLEAFAAGVVFDRWKYIKTRNTINATLMMFPIKDPIVSLKIPLRIPQMMEMTSPPAKTYPNVIHRLSFTNFSLSFRASRLDLILRNHKNS